MSITRYFFASVKYERSIYDYYDNVDGCKTDFMSGTFEMDHYPTEKDIIRAVLKDCGEDGKGAYVISYSELSKEQYEAFNSC
jgi:hypothetical protein